MGSFNNDSNLYLSIMKKKLKNKIFEINAIVFLFEYVFEIGKRLLGFISNQECETSEKNSF